MHAIKFNPTSELAAAIATPPRPASGYSPEWYKNLPAFFNKKPKITRDNPEKAHGAADVTVKTCAPFSDSMHAGYIQETWQDIYFEVDGDQIKFTTSVESPRMIWQREHAAFPPSEEFYHKEFVFHPPWTPEVPRGWSVLYLSPLNRPDLPFWFPSGLVDNDTFTHSLDESDIPFYVKKSVRTGVIPKGTPLYQMIPIKRESWQSSLEAFDAVAQVRSGLMPRTKFWGGYKKIFWTKKEYK